MTTTLFLEPNVNPPAVQKFPSTWLSAFNATASTHVGVVAGTLVPGSPTGLVRSASVAVSNASPNAGCLQFDGPPLAGGQTISGSVIANIGRAIPVTLLNRGLLGLALYKGDGTGIRGWLYALNWIGGQSSTAGGTLVTSYATLTLTSQTTTNGDFLVAEYGVSLTDIGSTTATAAAGGSTAISTTTGAVNASPKAYLTFSSTLTFIPYPPTTLSAGLNATSGHIDLTWTAAAAVPSGVTITSYTLKRATSSGTEASYVTGISAGATTYSDASLVASTRYYYTLIAVSSGGSSLDSNEATAAAPGVIAGSDSPLVADAGSGSTSAALADTSIAADKPASSTREAASDAASASDALVYAVTLPLAGTDAAAAAERSAGQDTTAISETPILAELPAGTTLSAATDPASVTDTAVTAIIGAIGAVDAAGSRDTRTASVTRTQTETPPTTDQVTYATANLYTASDAPLLADLAGEAILVTDAETAAVADAARLQTSVATADNPPLLEIRTGSTATTLQEDSGASEAMARLMRTSSVDTANVIDARVTGNALAGLDLADWREIRTGSTTVTASDRSVAADALLLAGFLLGIDTALGGDSRTGSTGGSRQDLPVVRELVTIGTLSAGVQDSASATDGLLRLAARSAADRAFGTDTWTIPPPAVLRAVPFGIVYPTLASSGDVRPEE